MKKKTIGCEEALKHLFAYLDQQLGTTKQKEVEKHLSICRTCFSKLEFEKELKKKLLQVGRMDVRSSFEERIKQVIRSF